MGIEIGGRMAFGTELSEVADASSGERLRLAMKGRGVTVSALSDMTGLSTRTITALRNGRSAGNMATWRVIARRLGCPISELVG